MHGCASIRRRERIFIFFIKEKRKRKKTHATYGWWDMAAATINTTVLFLKPLHRWIPTRSPFPWSVPPRLYTTSRPQPRLPRSACRPLEVTNPPHRCGPPHQYHLAGGENLPGARPPKLASSHRSSQLFLGYNPGRTAVPFWGQTSRIPSRLSPKRDCGTERGTELCIYGTLYLTQRPTTQFAKQSRNDYCRVCLFVCLFVCFLLSHFLSSPLFSLSLSPSFS